MVVDVYAPLLDSHESYLGEHGVRVDQRLTANTCDP